MHVHVQMYVICRAVSISVYPMTYLLQNYSRDKDKNLSFNQGAHTLCNIILPIHIQCTVCRCECVDECMLVCVR